MRRGLATSLLLFACAESPEVTLATRVGEPTERDPKAQLATVIEVGEALWEHRRPPRSPEATRDTVVSPPATPSELHTLIRGVKTGPIEEIAAPARNLAEAEASNWILVRAAMLAERPHPKGEYRSVLAMIGGDVPNRYGHFALHWKKAHGHRVKVSEDWFVDLLNMPLSKISRAMHDVYRDAVLEAALFRAAAKIGREHPALTRDVVEALLDAAYMHRGTFRDEVGRAIASIGDEAVPHLLAASIPPPTRARDVDSIPVKRADYAEYCLDRMDRLHPQRAVARVRDDPRQLAALLRAYGEARMGEAAEVLLDFVDSPTLAVREAARESFLAYVTGPTPKIRKKTLRLLGGGTTTKSAHVSYRGLAKRAIRERLERERPELLEAECDLFREDGSTDRDCEGQPERLARAYLDWIDAKQRAEQEAVIVSAMAHDDRDEAIAKIDRLLAAGARLDRPQRLVPMFETAAGEAAESGEPARAAQLLRKSSMLLASSDRAAADELRARALIHEASVPDLDAQGRNMLLGTARDLIGPESGLASALRDIHSARSFEEQDEIERKLQQGIALLLVILACIGLAGRMVRRRLYPSDST